MNVVLLEYRSVVCLHCARECGRLVRADGAKDWTRDAMLGVTWIDRAGANPLPRCGHCVGPLYVKDEVEATYNRGAA